MNTINQILAHNKQYQTSYNKGDLLAAPRRKLAILMCMDARINPQTALGLEYGDAHIIRNAGGIATEDAIRSLLASVHKMGVEDIMVINHTCCGMHTFESGQFREELEAKYGLCPEAPARFYTFQSLEDNIREQVKQIQLHRWMPPHVRIHGFLFDVEKGSLIPVDDAVTPHA